VEFAGEGGEVGVPEGLFGADAALGVELQQREGHALALGGVVQSRKHSAQPLRLVETQLVRHVPRQAAHPRPRVVRRCAQHLNNINPRFINPSILRVTLLRLRSSFFYRGDVCAECEINFKR